MQYVRSITKTWNSINPSTLSGAIDVVVVEQEDGTLACSPFHVRFGKFQLLRPSDKKVTFHVNGEEQKDIAMKLGEGGEAFFVFETTAAVPANLQTSPIASPVASPVLDPHGGGSTPDLAAPSLLDLNESQKGRSLSPLGPSSEPGSGSDRPGSPDPNFETLTQSLTRLKRSESDGLVAEHSQGGTSNPGNSEAVQRAINISSKLWASKVASRVSETGDLMLDMTGYKEHGDDSKQAENLARQILLEVMEDNHNLADLLGADEHGNIWIYNSVEAKEEALRAMDRAKTQGAIPTDMADSVSEIGYQSDEVKSDGEIDRGRAAAWTSNQTGVDSGLGMSQAGSPAHRDKIVKSYAKTLRLSSEQLKQLNLKSGENSVSFTVGKAVCEASMFYWRWDVPIVISDIDGTITKSDALGHVFNMIGRDWTHLGVAKLYTDITANGYNILYLTSRSVGQADTTKGYLRGVLQDGYRLPRGPVILSPDRTMAALRREVYLRKPEVFKMACLRDIMNLFLHSGASQQSYDGVGKWSPFYAGFGNRLTDALSYRSVNIPSTRIFTINSNAEVSLDLLTLSSFKTGYVSIHEIVDHYFPPVSQLVKSGGEMFTDFVYWREPQLQYIDFTASETSAGEEGEHASDDDTHDSEYDDHEPYDDEEEGLYDDEEDEDYDDDEDEEEEEEENPEDAAEGDDEGMEVDDSMFFSSTGREHEMSDGIGSVPQVAYKPVSEDASRFAPVRSNSDPLPEAVDDDDVLPTAPRR